MLPSGCSSFLQRLLSYLDTSSCFFPLCNQFLTIIPRPPILQAQALLLASAASLFCLVGLKKTPTGFFGCASALATFLIALLVVIAYLFIDAERYHLFAWLLYVAIFPLLTLTFGILELHVKGPNAA